MSDHSPADWAAAIAAVCSAIAALAALVIALIQINVAKKQLDVDLFDKRSKVYNLVSIAEQQVTTHGAKIGMYIRDLQQAHDDADNLFGHEIADLYSRLIDSLIDVQTSLEGGERDADDGLVEKVKAVRQAKSEIRERLKPFMQLDKGFGIRRKYPRRN